MQVMENVFGTDPPYGCNFSTVMSHLRPEMPSGTEVERLVSINRRFFEDNADVLALNRSSSGLLALPPGNPPPHAFVGPNAQPETEPEPAEPKVRPRMKSPPPQKPPPPRYANYQNPSPAKQKAPPPLTAESLAQVGATGLYYPNLNSVTDLGVPKGRAPASSASSMIAEVGSRGVRVEPPRAPASRVQVEQRGRSVNRVDRPRHYQEVGQGIWEAAGTASNASKA